MIVRDFLSSGSHMNLGHILQPCPVFHELLLERFMNFSQRFYLTFNTI